jgi:hypothetical protein
MSNRGGLSFFRNLAPRDRRALLLGLAAAVPILGYVFLVRPYRGAMADVRERVAVERDLLSRELALLAAAPGLPDSMDRAREETREMEGRLLQAPSLVLAEAELTDFLESTALRNRVLLEEIRTGELARGEASPPGLQVVRLHLRGESDLEGVLDFLADMEESRLILRVRGLALDPVVARSGGGEEEGPVRGSFPTGVLTVQLIVDGFSAPIPEAALRNDSDGGSG